jgi:hypothetical protein
MNRQEWTRRLLSFAVKLVRPVVLFILYALLWAASGPFGGGMLILLWIGYVVTAAVFYGLFLIVMTLLNGIAFYGRRILANRRNAGSQNPFNESYRDRRRASCVSQAAGACS